MKLFTFNDELSLVKKIRQLKLDHVKSKDMTVVGTERPTKEFTQHRDVEFVKGDGSIWESLLSKLFNSDPVKLVARRFNFSKEDYNTYQNALQSNQIVLIVEGLNKDNEEKDNEHSEDEMTDFKNADLTNKTSESKYESESPLEDEEFVEILDDYGLNSEREFIEKEASTKNK